MCHYKRFSFKAEWYQTDAHIMREFILNYYPDDECVEIFELRSKKTFLKRTLLNGVDEACFYPGAKLNVFGRQILLLDYADEQTRCMLAKKREKTFCIIKSHAIRQMADIMKILKEHDFLVSNCVMVEIDADICDQLMANSNETIVTGVVIAMELVACNAVQRMRKLLESHNCIGGQGDGADSGTCYGIDFFRKSVYGSKSIETVNKELELFFGRSTLSRPLRLVVSYNSTTLAIIKPHAIVAGQLVDICADITANGFIITAMKMFDLDREHCEEFYEVYKGVVDEYLQMVRELASGKFIALGIGADNASVNVYKEFRQLCGPSDPVVARQLYPKSIRAKFGVNKVQNAIHCTDLEEDCTLEIEYFFKILTS